MIIFFNSIRFNQATPPLRCFFECRFPYSIRDFRSAWISDAPGIALAALPSITCILSLRFCAGRARCGGSTGSFGEGSLIPNSSNGEEEFDALKACAGAASGTFEEGRVQRCG